MDGAMAALVPVHRDDLPVHLVLEHLGYLPLPTNTEHKVDIFGAQIP